MVFTSPLVPVPYLLREAWGGISFLPAWSSHPLQGLGAVFVSGAWGGIS